MDEDDGQYWISLDPGHYSAQSPETKAAVPPMSFTPAPASARDDARASRIRLLALVSLFLLATFLPWQRVCLGFDTPGFHLSGCLSASAWSGTASHFGQLAGVFAIVAILLLGISLGGIDFGDNGITTKIAIYGMAIAGSIKWIAVIGKLESFGAWCGLVLLLAIAILEAVERLRTPTRK